VKIKLLKAPAPTQFICSECGFFLMGILSGDKKSVNYTHHGPKWVKCSQTDTQFSLPVELEPFEVEAEVMLEKLT
jgi:hypothetical protein